MKIYISGPITGIPEPVWRKNFLEAQAELEKQGHFVVNPVHIGDKTLEHLKELGIWKLMTEKEQYQEYMKADLSHIPECHAIYLLKGWEKSNGAFQELTMAKFCGLEILLQGLKENDIRLPIPAEPTPPNPRSI